MISILPSNTAQVSSSSSSNSISSRVGRLEEEGGTSTSWIQKYSWILVPPFLISIISPSLFLKAIDFAGSYPVLLLYGVIPSYLRLRWNRTIAGRPNKNWNVSTILPYILFLISISMVSIETVLDVRGIVRFLVHKFATFQ